MNESRLQFISRHVRNACRFGRVSSSDCEVISRCDLCCEQSRNVFTEYSYINKRSGKEYCFNICGNCRLEHFDKVLRTVLRGGKVRL